MNNNLLRFTRVARDPRTIIVLSTVLFANCESLSLDETIGISGILVSNPELSIDGHFDVGARIVVDAFVERIFVSDRIPEPISGASVTLSWSSGSVRLGPNPVRQDGFYSADSTHVSDIHYTEGEEYSFIARVPQDAMNYGGGVDTPMALDAAAITTTPAGMPDMMFSNVTRHVRGTDLRIEWPRREGRLLFGHLTVYRANSAAPTEPETVFEQPPRGTASDIRNLYYGNPETTITIPGSSFSEAGVYAIVLVTMNRGFPSLLAGAGTALFLSVGDF